jgi:hypothetical protein
MVNHEAQFIVNHEKKSWFTMREKLSGNLQLCNANSLQHHPIKAFD